MIKYWFHILLVLPLFSFKCFTQEITETNRTIDSLINICRNSNRPVKERLDLALLTEEIALKLQVDSITVKVWRTLALMHLKNGDLKNYAKANNEYLELATRIKDTFSISAASANLGSYYRYIGQNDTAFYYLNNALKYYHDDDYSVLKAETLYNLAEIQQVAKIYDGAESDAIKALGVLGAMEI